MEKKIEKKRLYLGYSKATKVFKSNVTNVIVTQQ